MGKRQKVSKNLGLTISTFHYPTSHPCHFKLLTVCVLILHCVSFLLLDTVREKADSKHTKAEITSESEVFPIVHLGGLDSVHGTCTLYQMSAFPLCVD